MQAELIIYPTYHETHADFLDHLEEVIAEKGLVHYASSLLERGFHDEQELNEALYKACEAIQSARMPVHYHFRKVFICREGDIQYDWLVSDLGMRLIVLNADASNPILARLKIEVANRL